MVNYDSTRQYLNFNWTDFAIFVLVWCHMTWSQLKKTKTSHEESTGTPAVPYGAYFILHYIVVKFLLDPCVIFLRLCFRGFLKN